MGNKGIVYILTNPCLEGWVKIGKTDKDDMKERLNALNSPPNMPLSFRVYAIYRVENTKAIEDGIHDYIDTMDSSLHAIEITDKGRSRKREFFKMSPETAFLIFNKIAKLRGDEKSLSLIAPTDAEQAIETIAQPRRAKLNLKDLDILDNESLTFLYDENIVCTADVKKNELKYDGKSYSISALALKLLQEKCGWKVKTIAGGSYFKYNGIPLNDIKEQKWAET